MRDNRPDAIRVPLSFAGAGDSFSRLTKLQGGFAGILGVDRVYVRHQGYEHFITGDPADTLNFPGGSSRSGESRYDWEERGDGIFYGVLRGEV